MLKQSLLYTVIVGIMGLSTHALAADVNAVLPTNDNMGWGCTALIQFGDADPIAPTTNLRALQLCMNNCDYLYRNLAEQKNYTEMLKGTTYCRKSLNNLYFASIAQAANDDLDLKTQQQNAQLSVILEQIKAQQNQQKNQAGQQQPSAVEPSNEPVTTPISPTQTQQPPASGDGINWF